MSRVVVGSCLLLLLLINSASSCGCTTCSPLFQRVCCSFSPPNCCPNKDGTCPTPVPVIPSPGISARLCTGDQSCSGTQKCCSILQESTGRTFRICTTPVLSAK